MTRLSTPEDHADSWMGWLVAQLHGATGYPWRMRSIAGHTVFVELEPSGDSPGAIIRFSIGVEPHPGGRP